MGRSTTTAAHNDPERYRLQHFLRAVFYRATTDTEICDLDRFAADAQADYEYHQQQQEMTDRYRRRHCHYNEFVASFFDALDARHAPF